MGNLQFRVDWRFKIAFRQMVMTYALQIVFTFLILGIGYGMGGAPLNNYTFVFGIPSWWFLMMMVGVGFILLTAYMCLRVFKNVPTDDYIDQ